MRYAGYIFDLDGTIYNGGALIPGTDGVIAALREAGRRVVFVSNKPLSTPETYAVKLSGLGIPTSPAEVANSGRLTVRCLQDDMPASRVLLIGEDVLAAELVEAGFTLTESPEEADVVLVSLDRHLTYRKIHAAYTAAKGGTPVWATNPDVICPDGENEIVDAGATIAALEALLGRPIDRVIGKPSETMCQAVAAMVNLPPAECVMVGDRLDTDIAMGIRAGMGTALVLTGVTDRDRLSASSIRPDHVLERLEDLLGV